MLVVHPDGKWPSQQSNWLHGYSGYSIWLLSTNLTATWIIQVSDVDSFEESLTTLPWSNMGIPWKSPNDLWRY
jgi:hypothetical protein